VRNVSPSTIEPTMASSPDGSVETVAEPAEPADDCPEDDAGDAARVVASSFAAQPTIARARMTANSDRAGREHHATAAQATGVVVSGTGRAEHVVHYTSPTFRPDA
jgi:hypothetical protein